MPLKGKVSGKILEKLGYWRPRMHQKSYERAYVINKPRISYWLANGATPTKGVHRILEKFDFVPKAPHPYGSKHIYEKPEVEYAPSTMEVWRMTHKFDKDDVVNKRLQDELKIMEGRVNVESELYDPVNIEVAQTSDIDSDDGDVFERNIKFDELRKRFEKHREYSLDAMRGNDYRFNIYLRKMEKLSKSKYGGLDVESYKDYLNNLMQFRKIRADYNNDTTIDDKFDIGT